MSSRFLASIIACFAFVLNASAITITVKPDSGVILVWQQQKGSWTAVKDSVTAGIGDSLYLDDQYHAKLHLGKGCILYLRGELRATIGGSDTAVDFYLDQGQTFFKRESGAELANIKVILRKCAFVPIGTAAGIKYTKQGEPTAAVLAGKVRIEPPRGEPVTIMPGNFGIYDAVAAAFKEGKLAPEAIAALEIWSGTKLEPEGSAPAAPVQADTAKQAGADTAQKASQPATQPAAQQTATASQPAASAAAPASQQPQKTAAEVKKEEKQKQKELEKANKEEEKKQREQAAAKRAEKQKQEAQAAPASQAAAPSPAPEKKEEKPAQPAKKGEKPDEGKKPGISWEISAGSVTVDDEQWTRLMVSPDIPIWKFGLCLDVELFVNSGGDFSDKGWNFDRDHWAESLMRKIRYVRFGYEKDPVFVKFGALSSVTLGYGFVMDRFTNMLHYPDEKLLGLQFNLSNISPVGITLQTLISDFLEFKYRGGIVAGRLAVCPLKLTGVPIVSNISIGATYGIDINEYTQAHAWQTEGDRRDRNHNGVFDVAYWRSKYQNAVVQALIDSGDADTSTFTIDTTYRDSVSRYAVFGADIGVPIISSDFLGLDVYGQAAVVADTVMVKANRTGWGIGAPGVALRVGPVNARVEYRHIRGRFIPGYFGPYYLDERLRRYPEVTTRSQNVASKELDGVFGTLGFNIVDVVLLNGTYQYLMGKNDAKDQRLELSAGLGDALVKRIPKLSKAEAYLYKTEIGSTVMDVDSLGRVKYDEFFDLTPSFYWGYRIGIAITEGASLIWDARFGYKWDINHKLVPNNNVGISTAITF